MIADPPKKKKPFASTDTLVQPGATTSPKTDENPFAAENPFEAENPFAADSVVADSGSQQQAPKAADPLTFGKLASMGKSALVGAGHSLGVDKIGDEVSQQFAEFGADPQRGTKASTDAQAENPGSYLAGEIAPFVQPGISLAKGVGKLGGMAMGIAAKHPAEGAGLVAALTPTKIGKAWAVRRFVANLLKEQGAKAAAEAGAGETSILDRMRAATGGAPAAAPTPDLLPQGNADKILSQAFNAAGQDAQYVNSGKDAMAAGIQKLSQAPNPLSMEEAFNLAGRQGREASMGNAAMSEGISNIPQAAESIADPVAQQPSFADMMNQAGEAGRRATEGNAAMEAGFQGAAQQAGKPARLARTMSTLSKGMVGAGKPLSTNAAQATQVAMQALATGGDQKQIASMLAQQFDPTTVKFVLAGLPNRLP